MSISELYIKECDSYREKDFLQCVNVLCVSQVARYVWNKTDFDAVDPKTTDYLMGKFCCFLFLPSEALLFRRAEWVMIIERQGIPIRLLNDRQGHGNDCDNKLCVEFSG